MSISKTISSLIKSSQSQGHSAKQFYLALKFPALDIVLRYHIPVNLFTDMSSYMIYYWVSLLRWTSEREIRRVPHLFFPAPKMQLTIIRSMALCQMGNSNIKCHNNMQYWGKATWCLPVHQSTYEWSPADQYNRVFPTSNFKPFLLHISSCHPSCVCINKSA